MQYQKRLVDLLVFQMDLVMYSFLNLIYFFKYYESSCKDDYSTVGSSNWSYNITGDYSDKPIQINSHNLAQRLYFGDHTKPVKTTGVQIKQHKDVDYEKHTIEKEGKIYFASNPGKMDFIVCSNSSTSEYNFLVEEMENNNADSRISNNLVQLKDTYTEKYYMFGLALPPAYFKVVVEKDGYIVLSFISGDEKVNKTLNIEVKNEYGVQYSSYSKVPAGTYYVAVSSYGYDFIYARVKCEIKAYL